MPTIDDIAADVAQLRCENADLRAQIERLHTSTAHRGWQRSLAVLTGALAVTGLLALTGSRATAGAGAGPSVVVAPFKVVDKSGNRVMYVGSDGSLFLYEHEEIIAELVPDPSGDVTFLVNNSQNKQGVALGADATGSGSLQVSGAGDASKITLGSGKFGPALLITGTNTKPVAYLGANPDGSLLQLNDSSGRRRSVLGIDPAGEVQFSIFNPAGNTVALLDGTTKGGHLALANQGGIARVEAGVVGADLGEVNAYGPGGTTFLQGK